MNTKQFIEYGKDILEFLGNHHDNIADINVVPNVEPGYLRNIIPSEAPQEGEDFKDILDDVKTKIVPGIVNWSHPNFYAYFPLGFSYPSVLGELMNAGFGGVSIPYMASPAFTDLESIVIEWFAKAINLPVEFYTGKGGGVLQGSASEGVLICLMAARDRAIREIMEGTDVKVHESVYLPQLVAYTSSLAHSSVVKAARMSIVKLRILDVDSHGRLDSVALREAIQKDKDAGLTPFLVVASVGTTGICSFDNLKDIGKVCKETPSIWFHVDGAYAGTSFILPEMRCFMKGMKLADSFITNPHKHMLVSVDLSCMFVKDLSSLNKALTVTPFHLQKESNTSRNYSIAIVRRFRALKLWLVIRNYGIEGIQRYMRNHNVLAKRFEKYVNADDRFEVVNDVHLGLVCFRLKNPDSVNRSLLKIINQSGQYHMVPAMFLGKFILRFCLTYELATEEHIDDAWAMIQRSAENVLVGLGHSDKVLTPVEI